jgi:hypothetical protein
MFETRTPPEPDKILRLMGMFAADPRPDKVDLGVGVYRSPEGVTPIMAAVKTAERRIWETQETKSYVGIPGDPAYLDAMRRLILDDCPGGPCRGLRHPRRDRRGAAGAGDDAVAVARGDGLDLGSHMAEPPGDPEPPVTEDATYRYYDRETGGIDRDGMLADLAQAKAGDLILLHACCHNPTGADLRLATGRRSRRSATARAPSPSSTWPISASPKASRRTRRATPPGRDPAGGLHRRQLFQEFRSLPGTGGRGPDRHRGGAPRGRPPGRWRSSTARTTPSRPITARAWWRRS